MSQIKTCVSLYSLQDEYMRKRMTFEDMFKFMKENGVEGVEFLPDQMMHGAPHPSDETLAQWDRLVEEYGIKPVCIDVFLNTNLYQNRTLTKKESVQLLVEEIKLAHRLGVKLVRLVSFTPGYVLEPLIPYCKKYDVKIALEIHAGLQFDKQKTIDYVKEIKRLNSPYIGIVIDASIFCYRLPRVMAEYCRTLGTNDEVIDYVEKVFASGKDIRSCMNPDGSFIPELQNMLKTPQDHMFAHFADGYENEQFSLLDEYMPYVFHVHCKLYEMTEEGEEYSINYKGFLQYLHDHGYDGYVATEYEGNRWTQPGMPTVEKDQVQKHQAMLKKYIQEIEG